MLVLSRQGFGQRLDGALEFGQVVVDAVPGTSQGYQVTFGAGADAGLEIAGWHQVDLGTENSLQVGLDTPQADQAHVRGQVHEQVDVAVGPVLATGHAAEYPQVGHLMGGGSRD